MTKNILEEFIDPKVLSVLKILMFDDTSEFYLRELAKKAKVPASTTLRILRRLSKLAITETRQVKKTKLYKLAQSKNTKLLQQLFEEKRTILDEFLETATSLPGVQMIVMHGEESKDRTNLLVIGSGIDAKAIKEKVGDIKERYNFNIIELVLEPAQFNQMSSMGLFPSKKVILWERPSQKT